MRVSDADSAKKELSALHHMINLMLCIPEALPQIVIRETQRNIEVERVIEIREPKATPSGTKSGEQVTIVVDDTFHVIQSKLAQLQEKMEKVKRTTDQNLQELQLWFRSTHDEDCTWKGEMEASIKEQHQDLRGMRRYL